MKDSLEDLDLEFYRGSDSLGISQAITLPYITVFSPPIFPDIFFRWSFPSLSHLTAPADFGIATSFEPQMLSNIKESALVVFYEDPEVDFLADAEALQVYDVPAILKLFPSLENLALKFRNFGNEVFLPDLDELLECLNPETMLYPVPNYLQSASTTTLTLTCSNSSISVLEEMLIRRERLEEETFRIRVFGEKDGRSMEAGFVWDGPVDLSGTITVAFFFVFSTI